MTDFKVGEFERFMTKHRRHGFSIKRLPKSRFILVEIDYWTDPLKDTEEWRAKEAAKTPPKQFAVEMGRSWETFAGTGVYDKCFFKHLHVLQQPRASDPAYPIFRGWDFGGNQSVAIAQMIGPRLYILDELPNGGLNTETFAPQVIAYCNANFGPQYHYIDVIDPSAMWDTTRARENSSCADVMRELGLMPIPAPSNDPKKRIGAMIDLMRTLGDDGQPNLLFNPGCSMLIKGCEGGYHYPEKPSQSRKADQPVKNLFSHINDAAQYLALRLKSYGKAESDAQQDYEASLAGIPCYDFSGKSY